MSRALHPSAWPLSLKIPLLVAGLMVAIGAVLSNVVLVRLRSDQEAHLRLLTSAYLDGLSAAIGPALLRHDVWETFDGLDRSRRQYAGVDVLYAAVVLSDGRILAASDPMRLPTGKSLPSEVSAKFSAEGLTLDTESERAWLTRTLRDGNVNLGRLLAEIDISDILRVRREVAGTLVLVNGALTLAFALVGWFLAKRMVEPLKLLTEHVERLRDGTVTPIAPRHRQRFAAEFTHLFERFDLMARAVQDREALAGRLADEERYALLGKLASSMAHEVNNPLGGMLNAIDTLQVHGADPDVRQRSLEFLKRGLAGIRNVVRATLVTYKGSPDPGALLRGDLDDLPFLVQHEVDHRRLRLDWHNELPEPIAIEGAAVRQILLNLLLNACSASPDGGAVNVTAALLGGEIRVSIADEGPGMPPDIAPMLGDSAGQMLPPPGVQGLGLWTATRLMRRLGGRFELMTGATGTTIEIVLPLAERRFADAAA